jgi:hypothetical protein
MELNLIVLVAGALPVNVLAILCFLLAIDNGNFGSYFVASCYALVVVVYNVWALFILCDIL